MNVPRVAIACQGGGSHAAFTAGVLAELYAPANAARFETLALSGTSGGAVCAGLAWSGLLADGPGEAARRLEGFWADMTATDPIEAWFNGWTQFLYSLPFTFNASPYAYAPAAEPRLRALLTKWLDPDTLPLDRTRPFLRVGVADVLRGGGAALDGESAKFSIADIVASAAVPPLFRAVEARGTLWWDGLYAHNPPILSLLKLAEKPDEIWVIRLNPRARAAEPRTVDEIEDRRNEMAGNLPLDMELHDIGLVNRHIAAAPELAARFGYRPVTVREVAMPLPELTYQSKLDRSEAHIRRLMGVGRAMAPWFFEADSIIVNPEG
jgi:NTE family protein